MRRQQRMSPYTSRLLLLLLLLLLLVVVVCLGSILLLDVLLLVLLAFPLLSAKPAGCWRQRGREHVTE
jgi:hypothetical protein